MTKTPIKETYYNFLAASNCLLYSSPAKLKRIFESQRDRFEVDDCGNIVRIDGREMADTGSGPRFAE
jgi:hypothetical protein|tara:strand:+ start:108 stop:308 length:201 start_codon:yes stop_codon:yes gene_type:complete